MNLVRRISVAALLLGGLLSSCVPVDDLALTREAEQGFWRFAEMAESGRFGNDVEDINIGITAKQVQIELVRKDGTRQRFMLSAKRSLRGPSRYFDIVPGEGATDADVERIGEALDEVFARNPFVLPAVRKPRDAGEALDPVERQPYDSWRGRLRVIEWRMMAPASLAYAVGVIVALVLGLIATFLALWLSEPPYR